MSIIPAMEKIRRKIAASILAADFSNIPGALRLAEEAGSDWIHLDVMDGNFVPPITFGAQMTSHIRRLSTLPLDVHLMTQNPRYHLDAFQEAGVDRFTFHLEAEQHPHRLVHEIHSRNLKAGIAIVPSTSLTCLEEMLPFVDQVVVMTVNPGWGGQELIPRMLNKVSRLKTLREEGKGDYLILIDGGFNPETAEICWKSGVDVAVMGSAFFGASDPQKALSLARERAKDFKD